jgi:hypothetical protein
MRRYIIAGIVLVLCAGFQSQQEKEIVKAFNKIAREYIPAHIARTPTVYNAPCGWNKWYWEPSTDYTIDVRKTDSLVSPYVGVVTFGVTSYYTACHPTREEAEKDGNYPNTYDFEHRYTFSYQDDKWVLKSREAKVKYNGQWGDWSPCSSGPGNGGCLSIERGAK